MPRDVDSFAQNLIRRKAWRLIGQAGLTRQDVDDLQQELTLRFFQRYPAFNPGDPHHQAIATLIVGQCAATLLRDRRALKRDDGATGSLHVRVDDGDDGLALLAETITRRDQDAHLGVQPRPDEELLQLSIDVAEVIARLPPELRDLAERLTRQSVAEAARDLGVPRTTLYRKVQRLRHCFERAGLKDYLEQSWSSRS